MAVPGEGGPEGADSDGQGFSGAGNADLFRQAQGEGGAPQSGAAPQRPESKWDTPDFKVRPGWKFLAKEVAPESDEGGDVDVAGGDEVVVENIPEGNDNHSPQ